MGWFEDNSTALASAGISRDAAQDFVRRNPGDYHRVIEALDEDYEDQDRHVSAARGGSGGGDFDPNNPHVKQAVSMGMPLDVVRDFIAKNPGDYVRIMSALDENAADLGVAWPGAAAAGGGRSGGSGSGRSGAGGFSMADLQIPYAPWNEQFSPSISMPGDLMDPWSRSFTAPTYESVQQSPAFRFRIDEALKALERSAAAKGSYLTPNTMRDLQETSQAMASEEYGNEFGRQRGSYENDFGIFTTDKQRRGNTYFDQLDRDLDKYKTRYDIHRNNQLDPFGMGVTMQREGRADRALDFDIDQSIWGRGFSERGQDFDMGNTTRMFDFARDRDAWDRSRTSYRDIADDRYRTAVLGKPR